MTASEAIISWLETFSSGEDRSMGQIDTDLQGSLVEKYSLVRAPTQSIKEYLSGKKVYTDQYTFQAQLSVQSDAERMDNREFGEALENWIKEKNLEEEFPAVPDVEVLSVRVAVPFSVDKTEDDSPIYQMTIEIKYEKEK